MDGQGAIHLAFVLAASWPERPSQSTSFFGVLAIYGQNQAGSTLKEVGRTFAAFRRAVFPDFRKSLEIPRALILPSQAPRADDTGRNGRYRSVRSGVRKYVAKGPLRGPFGRISNPKAASRAEKALWGDACKTICKA